MRPEWSNWLDRLYDLRRDKSGSYERPHKPVLLLCIIALAALASVAQAQNVSPPAPRQIRIRETVVFDGQKGWMHDGVTYRLACGANIAQMPNGDLLCWWLSGCDNEPSTDNNVLASRSTDRGKTWGEPSILLAAGREAAALGVMHVTPSGKVIAFGAGWPSELQYTVWHFFRMESTDNGRSWSGREPVHVRTSDNIMFGRPIRLANGEYLCPTSFFEKRSKPLLRASPNWPGPSRRRRRWPCRPFPTPR